MLSVQEIRRLPTLLLFIPLVACAHDQAMLRYKDTQFLKVEQTGSSPLTALIVSGMAFHSALAVDNIASNVANDCVDVMVHLTPARQGLSGSFRYTVVVPDKVNAVCFGPDREVIWQRQK